MLIELKNLIMNKFTFIVFSVLGVLNVCSCTKNFSSLSCFKSNMKDIELLDSDTLITFEKGKVMFNIDEGESGDYKNIYTQFYINDELCYFIRTSKFFNSICYDGVLTETEEYEVADHQLKLIKRTCKDEEGNDVNPEECQFSYRHPFNLTFTLNEQ